jgi:hypothetical protein
MTMSDDLMSQFDFGPFTDADFETIWMRSDLTTKEKAAAIALQVKGYQEFRITPDDQEKANAVAYVQHKAREKAKEKYNSEILGSVGSLKLVTDAEILARPAPEWWVEGWFQKSTVGILAGQGGIGKSFLMLHFARCIAAGIDAFGRSVRKGNVLYVAAEGAGAFGARVRAWDAWHGSPPLGSRMHYLEAGVNLSSPESVEALKAVMVSQEIDFLILDTFSQLAAIDSENDAAQIAKVLKTAKDIRDVRPGSTVVLVHHVNKAGGQVRGSSAFRDNVDTLITAKGDEDGFHLSTLSSDYGKQKDGEGEKVGMFKLHSHLHSKVVVLDETVKPEDKVWTAVRDELLTATGPVKLSDLEDVSGVSHAAFSPRIKKWRADKLVRLVKVPGDRSHYYELISIPE